MSGGKVEISGEQRDALYGELLAHLSGFDALDLVVSREKDFETADRLAREFSDDLRLIVEGLGWGEEVSGPVALTMPLDDLRRILGRLHKTSVERYEAERPGVEESLANWEHTALVRDTCEEVLGRLQGDAGNPNERH